MEEKKPIEPKIEAEAPKVNVELKSDPVEIDVPKVEEPPKPKVGPQVTNHDIIEAIKELTKQIVGLSKDLRGAAEKQTKQLKAGRF